MPDPAALLQEGWDTGEDLYEENTGTEEYTADDWTGTELQNQENLEKTEDNAEFFQTIDGTELPGLPEETEEEEDWGDTYYSDGIPNDEQEWY